ncbi:MAG: hypothetical protein IJH67_11940 [Thermoguttaceae bacterium]|nr:hypothetical protein [Thermoguttaceae bacterium]
MSIKHIVVICGLSFVSLVLCGCPGQSVDTSDFESATNSAESSDQRKTERLFDNAIEALNRLEQDSSGESGDRVTGRLSEWIKTTPELKDWTPDPMTPDWQKDVQKNLPFIAQVAQQVQFARQDISLTIDKCVRLFQLQKELNALIQNQQAGATDQKTLDKIAKIKAEGDKINSELQKYQTPDSIKKLLEYLPKARLILVDESAPDYDPWNAAAFDAFTSSMKRIADDGLELIVSVSPDEILGMMDSVSSWLKSIAGDLALEELAFPESDIYYLEESIWLRDASEWAQGSSADDLSRVTALFDWTMKNIALESPADNRTRPVSEKEPKDCPSCRPVWQILLSGQGTAAERAWVFARLAEHQGLDVALVRVPIPEQPIPPAPAEPETPAPAEEQPAVTEPETPAEETAPTPAEPETPAPTEEQPAAPAEPETPAEETAPAPAEPETPAPTEEQPAVTEPEQPAEESESTSSEGEEDNTAPDDLAFPDIDSAIDKLSERYGNEPANKSGAMPSPEAPSLPDLPDVAPPERLLVAWIAEDKLYFFDPEYGLPIPAPNGVTLSTDAQDKSLKIVPATLEQILADESVLNRMSFTDSRNKERKYYLTPDDFKNAEFYLPVNPTSLSKRMWILETRLTGEQKMRLTSAPSEVKARLEKLVPGASVTLWDQPFAVPMFSPVRQSDFNVLLETVVNMSHSNDEKPLRRARVMHLKGTLAPQNEDDDCAVVWYQRSRYSEGKIKRLVSSPKNQIPPELFLEAGQFSTYWLGLLSDALDNHEAAEEYFRLIISQDGMNNIEYCWTAAAMYNIGRVEEETGQYEKAIDDYQSAYRQSPSYIGSALRAQLIKELDSKEK